MKNIYETYRKAVLVFGLLCFSWCYVLAQDIRVLDSLEPIYLEGNFDEDDRLEILYDLCFHHPDARAGIEYGMELIKYAEEEGNTEYQIRGHQQVGQAYQNLGENSEALTHFIKAAELAEPLNDDMLLGGSFETIGNLYLSLENYPKAEEYLARAIEIHKRNKDTLQLARSELNLGWTYYLQAKLDSAMTLYDRALINSNLSNYEEGKLYYKLNVGLIHSKRGDYEKANTMINEGLTEAMEAGHYISACDVLFLMAENYIERGELEAAHQYLLLDLELADAYDFKAEISRANHMLAKIHLKWGDTIQAYKYFTKHIDYRDSIRNLAKVQEIANLQSSYEVSQKQNEVNLLNQKRKTQNIITITTGIGLFLVALLALGLFRRYRFIKRVNEIIEVEKNRSDLLLMNILPEETAQELKDSGKVEAKRFESVSVLFADFQGFTLHSEDLSPEKLVRSVDYYFSEFDKIISRYGLEKIKTIGDAYMCAGGLPFPSKDHALKMTRAANEILNFMEQAKIMDDPKITNFDVRIGINSGPVVAGVVGKTKFAYDIWGDTVNVAARMEQNSSPGRINISENTYEYVKDIFECKFRGKIEVKNKGMMNMYYVQGLKAKKKKSAKTKKKSVKQNDLKVSSSK